MMMDLQADAYKNTLQLLVSQMKDSIWGFEDLVGQLKRSLEFSQSIIDEMKNEIRSLKADKESNTKVIEELHTDLRECREVMRSLTTRCNDLDDLQRRRNLKIDGLPEVNIETTEQTTMSITSLNRQKLELPDLTIEVAHRAGQRQENRPRPVVKLQDKLTKMLLSETQRS